MKETKKCSELVRLIVLLEALAEKLEEKDLDAWEELYKEVKYIRDALKQPRISEKKLKEASDWLKILLQLFSSFLE